MVDPQPVDDAVAEQHEHERVHVLEDFRQLDPQAGEVVDIEEAPIIDVVAGYAKVRGAPVLLRDESVERAPHAVVVGLVDALERVAERLAYAWLAACRRSELALQVRRSSADLRLPLRERGE